MALRNDAQRKARVRRDRTCSCVHISPVDVLLRAVSSHVLRVRVEPMHVEATLGERLAIGVPLHWLAIRRNLGPRINDFFPKISRANFRVTEFAGHVACDL